jgi:hypothetical protein
MLLSVDVSLVLFCGSGLASEKAMKRMPAARLGFAHWFESMIALLIQSDSGACAAEG